MKTLCLLVSALVAAMATASSSHAAEKHVVETPDYTYFEIMSCLSKKSVMQTTKERLDSALDDCTKMALGLTKEDFVNFVVGLSDLAGEETTPPGALKELASDVDSKLRPYFVAHGPALQTLSMSANDLGTLYAACAALPDSQTAEKNQCKSALAKLKKILQTPLPEINDSNIAGEDYIWLIKTDPRWANSPNDLALQPTCLWLMDPIGHVVYGRDGKPVTIWLEKGKDQGPPCY